MKINQLGQLGKLGVIFDKRKGGGGGDKDIPFYSDLIGYWSTNNKTNQSEDKALLQDLSDNGYDINLKNFAFEKMSGYGGFPLSFTSDYDKYSAAIGSVNSEFFNLTRANVTISTTNTLIILGKATIIDNVIVKNIDRPSFRVKITGVNSLPSTVQLGFWYTSTINGNQNRRSIAIPSDGIYDLPESEQVIQLFAEDSWTGFYITKLNGTSIDSCNLQIELQPIYEGGLVFDGVDDYGICSKDLPIFTKEKGYTIFMKRIRLSDINFLASNSSSQNNLGAFIFEGKDPVETEGKTYSFGASTNINYFQNVNLLTENNKSILLENGEDILLEKSNDLFNSNIVWQRSNKYVDQEINIGTSEGTNVFTLGSIINGQNCNFVFYKMLLYKRDLLDEEITEVLEWFNK